MLKSHTNGAITYRKMLNLLNKQERCQHEEKCAKFTTFILSLSGGQYGNDSKALKISLFLCLVIPLLENNLKNIINDTYVEE